MILGNNTFKFRKTRNPATKNSSACGTTVTRNDFLMMINRGSFLGWVRTSKALRMGVCSVHVDIKHYQKHNDMSAAYLYYIQTGWGIIYGPAASH